MCARAFDLVGRCGWIWNARRIAARRFAVACGISRRHPVQRSLCRRISIGDSLTQHLAQRINVEQTLLSYRAYWLKDRIGIVKQDVE
jgi:hypothetical protein